MGKENGHDDSDQAIDASQFRRPRRRRSKIAIVPNAPLRQKEISAIQSGAVPDVMEVADLRFTPLNAWDDNLIDLGDIVLWRVPISPMRRQRPWRHGCRSPLRNRQTAPGSDVILGKVALIPPTARRDGVGD
jgi:hypothetical protein